MQINGKPTPAEMSEANRMMRSNFTWIRLLARQAYALFAAGVIVWVLARAFASRRAIDWQNVGLLVVFLVVIVAFIWIRMQRITGRTKATASQSFPDTLCLETGGIKTTSGISANSFTPWTTFKSWRAGKKIIVLNYAEGKRFIILPFSTLSMPEQETLRGTVQSYLGPPSNRR